MAKGKQDGLGDELFGTRLGESRDASGPVKGEFVPPPDVSSKEEIEEALPDQEDFWRPPARFGTVPVEANPLGWDSRRGFHKLYPQVMLPTQVVERVSFGHPELEPNRFTINACLRPQFDMGNPERYLILNCDYSSFAPLHLKTLGRKRLLFSSLPLLVFRFTLYIDLPRMRCYHSGNIKVG